MKVWDSLSDLVVAMGFESEREFHHLVATAKIDTPETMAAFVAWKENDGTKAGLVALFDGEGAA